MQCPLLFGELEAGKRKRGLWASGKRTLKGNLHWCSIQLKKLKATVNDRTHWHSFTAVSSFEDNLHQRLMATFVLCHRACFGDITLSHLFKTLVFQTGFAEPSENPSLITHHTVTSLDINGNRHIQLVESSLQ